MLTGLLGTVLEEQHMEQVQVDDWTLTCHEFELPLRAS